ncbi:MAG: ROK family transcriptional regulator [Microbacteriaceae bacterium]
MGRALRPQFKVLPEDARGHNRALVLQTLYREHSLSRADIARQTGLTRVTISDLVAELIGESLVIETGQREEARPGKPATMLEISRSAFQIIGIDLSPHDSFRGSVLDIDGRLVERREVPLEAATGAKVTELVMALIAELIASATLPILGIGIGSPGIVDLDGVVLSAPNLGWMDEPLQRTIEERFQVPVIVANDANVATLAEHSFGSGQSDMLLVKVGHGVGAGLVVDGSTVHGSRFAAGEIGHVVVGTDGGPACACGKHGCLEAWVAAPRLEAALADASTAEASAVLRKAGGRLGIALAPIVGALNLAEIVLSGPVALLGGSFLRATEMTLRKRTSAEFHGQLTVRLSMLGDDIVMRGAAAIVLASCLGVS